MAGLFIIIVPLVNEIRDIRTAVKDSREVGFQQQGKNPKQSLSVKQNRDPEASGHARESRSNEAGQANRAILSDESTDAASIF